MYNLMHSSLRVITTRSELIMERQVCSNRSGVDQIRPIKSEKEVIHVCAKPNIF